MVLITSAPRMVLGLMPFSPHNERRCRVHRREMCSDKRVGVYRMGVEAVVVVDRSVVDKKVTCLCEVKCGQKHGVFVSLNKMKHNYQNTLTMGVMRSEVK